MSSAGKFPRGILKLQAVPGGRAAQLSSSRLRLAAALPQRCRVAKRSLRRAKGRLESGSFVRFPHALLRDPAFLALSPAASKVLLYGASQYRGSNNGDLDFCSTNAKRRSSPLSGGMLLRGVRELEAAGFLVKTRQGGKNRASLYALGWFPIDDCNGKLDVLCTTVAPNTWRQKPSLQVKQSAAPVEQSQAPPTNSLTDYVTHGAVSAFSTKGLLHQ